MEHDYQNSISITRLSATIADIAGFEAPAQAEPAVEWLANIIKAAYGGAKANKVLIFSADAVPLWMVRKNTEMFASVYKHAPISLCVRSVDHPMTPIAYAAFFSGAFPEINGVDKVVPPILTPEVVQPLITCDTLMAAAVRAGLHVAVVTCANGCIASMLSQSGAHLYMIDGDDDEAMFAKAEELVENNYYDFVFLYQLGFDYSMHEKGPESVEALSTLQNIINRFDNICETAKKTWQGNCLFIFNSDHGAHFSQGKGSHGVNISEDTDIIHFFGTFCNV